MTKIQGYKGFDQDLKCLGFQYEIGKTYIIDGPLRMCENGFHFCRQLKDVYEWKNIDSRICEIEAQGNIIHDDTKSICSKITIIRELDRSDLNLGCDNLGVLNSGHRNSGHRNSGDWNCGHWNSGHWNSGDRNSGHRNSGHWNSGDRNSGDRNSGHRNSGHWNSGDWNSGDRNCGFFNSNQPSKVRVFNHDIPINQWKNIDIPDFCYFNLTIWIGYEDMTPQEKKQNPNAKTFGGYLKSLSYKEAWRHSWNSAPIEDKQKILAIPNFDNDVFFEISGINVFQELGGDNEVKKKDES